MLSYAMHWAPNDGDHDGLSDCDEAVLGTRPDDADTDDDALPDGWEVRGVNGLPLYLQASPTQRDIFVWMDSMGPALAPTQQETETIQKIFFEAGVRIHLEAGRVRPSVSYEGNVAKGFLDTRSGFPRERMPVYHYMVWAHRYSSDESSGLAVEGIGGPDFMVTLGSWALHGTSDQKVGTFVHELGHALGLRHGGPGTSDDASAGPNHLSVMNYNFQTVGVWFGEERLFGYQRVDTIALVEARLDERRGIGNHQGLAEYFTSWKGHENTRASTAIDWDGVDGFESDTHADLGGSKGTKDQWPAIRDEWKTLELDSKRTIGSTEPLEQLDNRIKDMARNTRYGYELEKSEMYRISLHRTVSEVAQKASRLAERVIDAIAP